MTIPRPGGASGIALGDEHRLLSFQRWPESANAWLYERVAVGRFEVVQSFDGLERVFHPDDTRIAGLTPTGAAVRLVSLAPHGSADVTVCEEGGTVVCEAAAPTAPTPACVLRIHTLARVPPPPRGRCRGCPTGRAQVDAFGRASLGFDVSHSSLSALFQEALFVQALVIDGGATSATEAVRSRL